ncbi:HNH endonuclease [Sphingomonas sp.]|uniref:HNH endonuclease n=1 Tax=Sphingomonas sp. TaxID=28214 RepID=UPI003AFF6C7D
MVRLFQRHTKCAHCGTRLTRRAGNRRYRPTDATLDHVVPLSLGGLHGLSNVVVACSACNFARPRATLDSIARGAAGSCPAS